MVEGPGCKIKGEKIRGKLKEQTVKAVSGNAVVKEIKPTKGITTSKFDILLDRKLDDVQTLGKELFMYFGDVCLRVHFLMAGSFRVNDQQLDNDYGKQTETPSLQLNMSPDVLKFYKSAVDIRPSEGCRSRYQDLNNVDICSPIFNHKRAVAMVMEEKERLVCDVLLDQTILPGVGNIIKNEALFDSGIKPSSKVKELSEQLVSHLVKMTRDFSLIFYKCRKDGISLNKYMKIYKKGKCGQCEGKVTITRLGEDSVRVTYFCPCCQTNTLRSNSKTLPTKNSLLGWVQKGQELLPDWTCSVCTLINKGGQLSCAACLTPCHSKGEDHPKTHDNPEKTTTTVKISQPSSKRKSDADLLQNKVKRTKTENKNPSTQQNSQTCQNIDVISETNKIPFCPGHSQLCRLIQVRKKGDNYLRWFFTCGASSKSKQCKFFQWADERFPICLGHGKPATIRTVMKQGSNNGRKFFACALPKQKQCGFFEWAVGYENCQL